MTAHEPPTEAAERNRTEWKVLLVLALSLLLAEALVRSFAGSLSLDLRNTLESPKTARDIARAPDGTRTVLVVGNSLARHGADLASLGRNTGWPEAGEGSDLDAKLFAPDGSSVVHWDWGLRRYFANTGSYPDVILLLTGRVHLLDVPTSPEPLGAYFVGLPDLGAALKTTRGSEESMRLLLGVASHLLANRDRVRTRIGYSHLPGFEVAWPTLTTAQDAEPDGVPGGNGSTEALERLIATAQEMGADLHVFSVPMPEPYQVPDAVLRVLAETDTPFHDLSVVSGITPENFPDGYHLDEAGSVLFTEAILVSLRQQIPGNRRKGGSGP